jgi:hypothetical protein
MFRFCGFERVDLEVVTTGFLCGALLCFVTYTGIPLYLSVHLMMNSYTYNIAGS